MSGELKACPKCGARSGDDWEQCLGRCPMSMSPHYKALAILDRQPSLKSAYRNEATPMGPLWTLWQEDVDALRDAILSSLHGDTQPVAWPDLRDIATAPRDGSHILVTRKGTGGFGSCGPVNARTGLRDPQDWFDVVHWFNDPDEPGFYSSTWSGDQEHPFDRLTHWAPLSFAHPSPEQAGEVERLQLRWEAEVEAHGLTFEKYRQSCVALEAAEQAVADLKAEQALDRAAMQAVVDASPMNAPIYRLSERLSKGAKGV
jgi:hypothetical protein